VPECAFYLLKRCAIDNGVDLVGRYSNPPYTPGDLRELTEMIPDGMVNRATGVAPRQRQHRLRPQELEQLTSDYRSGVAVNDLAARYDIDRHTVIEHMRRQGVPRRYPRLGEDEVREAIRIYQSGASLAATGHRLGVDPGTVSRALQKAGMSLRDCHGRER
jgi:transposase-like protein